MRLSLGALAALVACSGAPNDAPMHDAARPDMAPEPDAFLVIDHDMDGLDDAYETKLATDYVPFISLDPEDGCSRSGLAVRVRKHPADATKILVIYDHLFETDCGLNGHTGDNEAFGIVIDPAKPGPDGILAILTVSHQGTPCERVTECTTCANDSRRACDRQAFGGAAWPVLYASKGKHGQYANKCSTFGTCLDTCTLAQTPHRPPIANVGEPAHPLITNLTTQGFITAANGWTKSELMNVNPWGPDDFGGAGNVADDLVDEEFVPAPCAN
jgi:hypothetical protein